MNTENSHIVRFSGGGMPTPLCPRMPVLDYLHRARFVHLEVAAETVFLLTPSASEPHAKLGDCGSGGARDGAGAARDVAALGVLAFECATLGRPFSPEELRRAQQAWVC